MTVYSREREIYAQIQRQKVREKQREESVARMRAAYEKAEAERRRRWVAPWAVRVEDE